MNGNSPLSLVDRLHQHAKLNGGGIAYTFLNDGAADAQSITWSQLDQRAAELGVSWQARGAAGQPILLALPSGLKFVESLFACWHAGAIAVPVSMPRHHRAQHRLHQILADAGARFVVGDENARQRLCSDQTSGAIISNLTWLDTSAAGGASRAGASSGHGEVAVLQYTSGSTGSPRGVMVTHANLMHNCAMIASACGGDTTQTIGGWLPLFHDMGLVGLILQAAFSGVRCVFMAPERFLMRPWLWLRMISDYKICSSAAPNFAYDLCVDRITEQHKSGLDLSSWKNAINGSEPVRASTLDRFASAFKDCGFRKEAFFPCYGLAEATLLVTGPEYDLRRVNRPAADGALLTDADSKGYVGCGHPHGDTQIAIVNPQTTERQPDGAVGEIWVSSPGCAKGYWNDPAATAAVFQARLSEKTSAETNSSAPRDIWLRTGDLGFIMERELFITGRLRELIIIAGRNLFPLDLERTAESADPAVATSSTVAFSIDIADVERLIILAELRRELGRTAQPQTQAALDLDAIRRRIRAAIAAEHDVAAHDVVLLKPGALPRTTSGKLRRGEARDLYLSQTLERFDDCHANAAS